MSEHVYKTIEITGASAESQEDAMRRAIRKASESVQHLRWFEVVETRGSIEGGDVSEWQVTIKIGFTLN